MADREKPWWTAFIDADSDREVSEEEWAAIMAAVHGVACGDLQPLAKYLRQGYPLHYMVRREIVSAIEGDILDAFYKPLKLEKRRKRGVGHALSGANKFAREAQIVDYFEKQLLLHGNVESASAATEKKFEIGRSTVMAARKAQREWLEAAETKAAQERAKISSEKRK